MMLFQTASGNLLEWNVCFSFQKTFSCRSPSKIWQTPLLPCPSFFLDELLFAKMVASATQNNVFWKSFQNRSVLHLVCMLRFLHPILPTTRGDANPRLLPHTRTWQLLSSRVSWNTVSSTSTSNTHSRLHIQQAGIGHRNIYPLLQPTYLGRHQ